MLDFGWAEFIIIALIGLIVVGPKDIPKLMYQAGRLFRRLHYMKFALSQQFDDFMEKAEASAQSQSQDQSQDKNQDQSQVGAQAHDRYSADTEVSPQAQDKDGEEEHLEMDETNPYFVRNDAEADLDRDVSSLDDEQKKAKGHVDKA